MNEKLNRYILMVLLICVISFTACSKDEKVTSELQYSSENISENSDTSEISNNSSKKPIEKIFDSTLSGELSNILKDSKPNKEVIDPFEKLIIETEGLSPYIVVTINNSYCSEVIQENVEFQIEKENGEMISYMDDKPDILENGDTIIVTAVYDKDNLKKLGYSIENPTKKYTVKSVDGELITSVKNDYNDGMGLYSIRLNIKESNDEALSRKSDGKSERFAGINFKSIDSVKLKSAYFLCLKDSCKDKYAAYGYLNADAPYYNSYIEIYEFTVSTTNNQSQKVYVARYADNIYNEYYSGIFNSGGYVVSSRDINETFSNSYKDVIEKQVYNSKQELYDIKEINIENIKF